jgi:hypothetical protein
MPTRFLLEIYRLIFGRHKRTAKRLIYIEMWQVFEK